MMSYTRWTRVGIMVVPMRNRAVNFVGRPPLSRRATRLMRAPSFRRDHLRAGAGRRSPPLGAGGGRVGFRFAGGGLSSSESAAGSGPLRGSPARRLFGCNCELAWQLAGCSSLFESAAASVVALTLRLTCGLCVGGFGWL
jgi:hypothetical protein